MKTTILFILLLTNSILSSAQKINVFWGDMQKLKRSTLNMEVLFADKSGVYATDIRNGGYFSMYSNFNE